MMNLENLLNPIFGLKKSSHFDKKMIHLTSLRPKNITFYKEAFTHSAKTSNHQEFDFERLEFLGDALLNAIVTCHLFNKRPDKNEGDLTKLRSKIVRRSHLNKIGKKLNLTHYLLNYQNQNLGANIHGNLLESLIGAIFLDLGYEKCERFVHKTILSDISLNDLENTITSYKSFIHEWCQKQKLKLEYHTEEEENAEDNVVFVSIIKLDNEDFVKGRANNKKSAEENASKRAYYALKKEISKADCEDN